MAHPLESEYVTLETFTEAQPADGAEDTATVSSPDMDRLSQPGGGRGVHSTPPC